MSLLLDALKKAADDKQKASQKDSPGVQASDNNVSGSQAAEDPVSYSQTESSVIEPENPTTGTAPEINIQTDELELTLDEIPGEEEIKEAAAIESHAAEQVMEPETENNTKTDSALDFNYKNGPDVSATGENAGYTVTDDALTMLIYKTNKEVKHDRKYLYISIFIVSFAVILVSGYYYYQDMEYEIAMLESNHQKAMRTMQAKTSGKNAPKKSEIIQNLVSDNKLEEKVEFAKQQMANNQVIENRKKISGSKIQHAQPNLSIQRTQKSDPVGDRLDVAWLAYEKGDYPKAKADYQAVLKLEENNRDAMLGLGAIAIVEKDFTAAQQIYRGMLQLNPNDPDATAALITVQANLSTDESSLQSDEQYLLAMLEKNHQAPQLNFALGNNYAQQNKWHSAQQYYFNAWQLDSDNPDYIYNLAVSLDQINKKPQALTFYQKSLDKAGSRNVSFSRDAVQKRINELSSL